MVGGWVSISLRLAPSSSVSNYLVKITLCSASIAPGLFTFQAGLGSDSHFFLSSSSLSGSIWSPSGKERAVKLSQHLGGWFGFGTPDRQLTSSPFFGTGDTMGLDRLLCLAWVAQAQILVP